MVTAAADKVTLLFNDQKVHVYRRDRSRFWQCSTCLDGINLRETTKEANLAAAQAFAEEWYLKQRQLLRKRGLSLNLAAAPASGEITDRRRRKQATGPKFAEACDLFVKEYPVFTQGQRNEKYMRSHEMRINANLLPFSEKYRLSEIGEALISQYREHRIATFRGGKVPAHSTINHDIVTLRLILKTAKRRGLIETVPDMSEPYKRSKKVRSRPWFSPEEYKQLYTATAERAKNPKKERWRAEAEDLHDLVLFAANSGLRPDELGRLQVRDVNVDSADMNGTEVLHIRVTDGKMGFGNCKTMPGAVHPYRRVLARRSPKPNDLLFPNLHRELLNDVLRDTGLKTARDGQLRSLYSLRHSYICMRLMQGAQVYDVAKNCRTSVEMIQKHYADHIKELIDASAINVKKPAAKQKRPARTRAGG